MSIDKKVLIFDLGGVLLDLHVEKSFAAFVELGFVSADGVTDNDHIGYVVNRLQQSGKKQRRRKGDHCPGHTAGGQVSGQFFCIGPHLSSSLKRIRPLQSRGRGAPIIVLSVGARSMLLTGFSQTLSGAIPGPESRLSARMDPKALTAEGICSA